MSGGITGFLQKSREERRTGVEPVGHVAPGIAGHPGKVPINIVTGGKVSGHHRGATRRTDPTGYREPVKVRTLPRKAINIRGLDIRVTVTPEIPPAPVIGEDEQDVGFLCRGRR